MNPCQDCDPSFACYGDKHYACRKQFMETGAPLLAKFMANVPSLSPTPPEPGTGKTIREDVNELFEQYDEDKIILAELACRVSTLLDNKERELQAKREECKHAHSMSAKAIAAQVRAEAQLHAIRSALSKQA